MAFGSLFGNVSESTGLYGIPSGNVYYNTYFEWFIFKEQGDAPATPTGGSWNFDLNTGTPPTGWSNGINTVPLGSVWVSIAFIDSRNPTSIVWSTPGLLSDTSVYATAYADVFTGDGATVDFTLTADPIVINNLDVSVDGVVQTPVTNYTFTTTTLTFTTAPHIGAHILVKYKQSLPAGFSGAASEIVYTAGASALLPSSTAAQAFDNVSDESSGSSYVGFLQSGTGAVPTTVQAKLRESVSVKDFGAVGDGIADDTDAITAAMVASRGVYFPAGTYLVTGLTLQQYAQRLFGETQESSIIKLAASANTYVLDTNEKSAIVLQNLKIDGNRDNNTASLGIRFYNSYYVTVENVDVRFTNGYAVHGQHTYLVEAINFQVHYTDSTGIYLESDCKHWSFQGGGVEDVGVGSTYGINCEAKNCQFNNMWIEWNATYASMTGNEIGIRINGMLNSITNCIVTTANASYTMDKGIWCGGSSQLSMVAYNTINNATYPVYLNGASHTNGSKRTIIQTPSSVTNADADRTTFIGWGADLTETELRARQIYVASSDTFDPGTKGELLTSVDAPIWYANAVNGSSGLRINVDGGGSNVFRVLSGGTTMLDLQSNRFLPKSSSLSLGDGSHLWTEVFAANGTINTSDERFKQDIRSLSDAERAVAVKAKGLLKAFRMKDAVVAKGSSARIHFGIVAQELQAAFASEGLNADDYGVFCHDSWGDEFDEDGNQTQVAGDRYGVRYEELLAFILGAI